MNYYIDNLIMKRIKLELRMRSKEIAELCGISVNGLNNWLRTNKIPFNRWEQIKAQGLSEALIEMVESGKEYQRQLVDLSKVSDADLLNEMRRRLR